MIVKANRIKKITFTLENHSTEPLEGQSFGSDASNIFKRQEKHVMKQEHAQNLSAVRNLGTKYNRKAQKSIATNTSGNDYSILIKQNSSR